MSLWLWMLLSQLGGVFLSVCFWLSACVKACVHWHVNPSKVNMCVSLHKVCMSVSCVFVLLLSLILQRWLWTMGTDITVGGRGVSRQAAGYPITLGLLLRPLPSSLPRQRSAEVKQAPPSVIILPSPAVLCLWQQNFLQSLQPLLLKAALALYDRPPLFFFLLSAFMIFTFCFLSICSPVLFPFTAIYLSLFALLIYITLNVPLSFSLTYSETPGSLFLFTDLLLSLQLISKMQQGY